MFNLLLVACGGATGAIFRYVVTNIIKIYFHQSIYGTFCINILGSFFIGYLISIGYMKNLSENFIKYFLIIGFLGSFTTFSTFSYEVIDIYFSKKLFLSALYVISSVTLCIVAAYFGMYINKP